jgi:hypothetical protein
MHIRLFAFGSKYQIRHLKERAVWKFEQDSMFLRQPFNWIDFATAIDIAVATGTDREPELRDCIARRILGRINEVLLVPGLLESIKKCDDLQLSIIAGLAAKNLTLRSDYVRARWPDLLRAESTNETLTSSSSDEELNTL